MLLELSFRGESLRDVLTGSTFGGIRLVGVPGIELGRVPGIRLVGVPSRLDTLPN